MSISDWLSRSPTEQALTRGHFKRFPYGDPFTHYLLAQVCVMICDLAGAKKSGEQVKKRPDPKDYGVLDFAPWLKDSQLDTTPEWNEADDIQAAGLRILDAVRMRRQELETNGTAN